jgi:hypothetical protein
VALHAIGAASAATSAMTVTVPSPDTSRARASNRSVAARRFLDRRSTCAAALRASLLSRWSEKDTGIHPAISLAARQARKTFLMGLVGAVAGIAELRVLNAPWVIRSRRVHADESNKDYGA